MTDVKHVSKKGIKTFVEKSCFVSNQQSFDSFFFQHFPVSSYEWMKVGRFFRIKWYSETDEKSMELWVFEQSTFFPDYKKKPEGC